jgi:hypothetical protein
VEDRARLLDMQSGVAARRQLLESGMTSVELARSLRRGELVRVHPRVFVVHNGPLSWLERAWAAVLWAEPAGLCGTSALRASHQSDLTVRDGDPIHLMVDRGRRLVAPRGVVLHRSAHFADRVQLHLGPPRVRYEHTVLDLAEEACRGIDAVAVLADACGSRRTTAGRLTGALARRPWAHRRAWIGTLLVDISSGTCSVLEHGYLTRVERPHGVPRGSRQFAARMAARSMWRDVLHEEWGFLVELDGRLGHTAQQDRDWDLERDLDAVVHEDRPTVRLGYRQVFATGCRTSLKLARVLNRLGWPGVHRPCPKCGVQDQAA